MSFKSLSVIDRLGSYGFWNGRARHPKRSWPDSFLPPKPPPKRLGFHPGKRRSCSWSTIISLSSIRHLSMACTELRASALESYSINAYCFDAPVTMSRTKRQFKIFPYRRNFLSRVSWKWEYLMVVNDVWLNTSFGQSYDNTSSVLGCNRPIKMVCLALPITRSLGL